MEIKILYEDNNMIAVEKPCGVPVQPDKTGDDDLLSSLKQNVFIINRIDRPVGGIVLFAKNKTSASELSLILQSGSMKKIYSAVICGSIKNNSGIFTDYLLKDERLNISKVVSKDNFKAKEAKLEYKVIEEIEHNKYGTISLVQINLITGRHHQIRVQFSSRGFPLWGDSKYNKNFKYSKVFTALWASFLCFEYKGKNITIKSMPENVPFNLFECLKMAKTPCF